MTTPTLAVWKFTSCDGCQLTLLDCEDELLTLSRRIHIAHFLEASNAPEPGPCDISLVEGSITTPDELGRIIEIREQSRILVAIGACATHGGIQALRNFADVTEFTSLVYADPQYISTLATATPISAHVQVDYELRGCPSTATSSCASWTPSWPVAHPISPTPVDRMQTPRYALCDRRRGHPVSGPGHPRRLRRAAPSIPPRLLRLLRTDDQTEYRCAASHSGSQRHAAARHRPGVPHCRGGCARIRPAKFR